MTTYHVPYTYHIAWSNIDRHYYGVRFARGCQPSDLWVKYFTSSAEVKRLRESYGEPDVIEVRRTFSDAHSALLWEQKVLTRLKVLDNDRWLNKSISGDHYIIIKHSEETKRLMSKNSASKRPEQKLKISKRQIGSGNSFYGRTHTHQSNMARRAKLLGVRKSEEHREKHRGSNNHFFGKSHSDEIKKVMSDTKKLYNKQNQMTCPHCGKTCDPHNARRWHLDNCKMKKKEGE